MDPIMKKWETHSIRRKALLEASASGVRPISPVLAGMQGALPASGFSTGARRKRAYSNLETTMTTYSLFSEDISTPTLSTLAEPVSDDTSSESSGSTLEDMTQEVIKSLDHLSLRENSFSSSYVPWACPGDSDWLPSENLSAIGEERIMSPFIGDSIRWGSPSSFMPDYSSGLGSLPTSSHTLVLDDEETRLIYGLLQELKSKSAVEKTPDVNLLKLDEETDQENNVSRGEAVPDGGQPGAVPEPAGAGACGLGPTEDAPAVLQYPGFVYPSIPQQCYLDDPTRPQFIRTERMLSVIKRPPNRVSKRTVSSFFRECPSSPIRSAISLAVGASPAIIKLVLDYSSIAPIQLEAGLCILTWAKSKVVVNSGGLFKEDPVHGHRRNTGLTMQIGSRHFLRPLYGFPNQDTRVVDDYQPGMSPRSIHRLVHADVTNYDPAMEGLAQSLAMGIWPPHGLVHIYDVSTYLWEVTHLTYSRTYELPMIMRTFSPNV